MTKRCSTSVSAGGVALVALLAMPLCGNAGTIETTFEIGLEGWTAVGDGSISWQSAGGNPGAYFQASDPATGANTWAVAPPEYLGNWLALDGSGVLSADLTIISGGSVSEGAMFQVSGPGGSAEYVWPASAGPPHGQWATYSRTIAESEWTVTSGTWAGLLANVTDLRIDMEHITGVETTGLDNVRLVPEPSTIALIGMGAIGLLAFACYRRSK